MASDGSGQLDLGDDRSLGVGLARGRAGVYARGALTLRTRGRSHRAHRRQVPTSSRRTRTHLVSARCGNGVRKRWCERTSHSPTRPWTPASAKWNSPPPKRDGRGPGSSPGRRSAVRRARDCGRELRRVRDNRPRRLPGPRSALDATHGGNGRLMSAGARVLRVRTEVIVGGVGGGRQMLGIARGLREHEAALDGGEGGGR
jgi:hypothetical protein